jgi:CubicO group peptidase (beta-lactamase class C family)
MLTPATTRISVRALFLLFVMASRVGGVIAPIPTRAALTSDFAEIDTYITDLMQVYEVPGTAIALVKDGKIIYVKGYGARNVDTQAPVTGGTLFAIGSISKSFTALAVLQLADRGQINLDDHVTDYLPDFRLYDPQSAKRITIRELLAQTSGVPRADDLWWPDGPANRKQIVDDLRKVQLTTVPGQRFQYSNQNYALLGYLVEKITGQTWESYVQTHILKPLGMRSTDFDIPTMQRTPNHADAHILDQRKGLMPVGFNAGDIRWLNAHGPAVSINASARDMARYVQFQLGDGTFEGQPVLSQDMLNEMHHQQAGFLPGLPFLTEQGYGMGWFTEKYRGYSLVEHSGDVKGFAANITLVPSEKIGVVVLTNVQTVESFRQAVRIRLTENLLGIAPNRDIAKLVDRTDLTELKKDFETARTFKADAAVIAKLPGDYLGVLGQVHIELSDGRLFARPQGWLLIYELAPFAPDKVLYSAGTLTGSLVLSFKIDAQNSVTFYQDGVKMLERIR